MFKLESFHNQIVLSTDVVDITRFTNSLGIY